MVRMHIDYEGDLHCKLTHEPSGATFATDAPKDNMGRGAAFSPTDLVAASLGSCILTTMAIYAKRKEIPFGSCSADVEKEMTASGERRIQKISVRITMPKSVSQELRPVFEKVAASCPVHKSLRPEVEIPVRFKYPD